jgi:hypothetical protein
MSTLENPVPRQGHRAHEPVGDIWGTFHTGQGRTAGEVSTDDPEFSAADTQA